MARKDPPVSSPAVNPAHEDGRLVAPSAERNESPIIEALGPMLAGRSGLFLEIGSGTGQHIAAWARSFPDIEWQPSDPFEVHHDSIRAWVEHSGAPNARMPVWLDAAEPWPDLGPLAGVISVNVIHITPWVVAKGIIHGAATHVRPGGLLVFYGPFKEAGAHTGEGNARFDERLRAQDPAWGIRDLDDVAAKAAEAGFGPPRVNVMPANNRLVVFEKA